MRLWPRSEGIEDDDGVVDPPADIAGIMEYSAFGGPDPRVTLPAEETISPSGWGFSTAGDGESYVRRSDGEWEVL